MTARTLTVGFLLALLTGAIAQPPALSSPLRAQDQNHAHPGRAEHTFADVERYTAMFDSPARAQWQKPDELVAALQIAPGSVVADVGAGTGYFAVRFAEATGARGTVLASDIEPGMVAYLRRRAEREGYANLIPILASADNPRLPDASVNLIFFCNTWHHISNRVAYAGHLLDDLALGGRVVVVDFLPGDLPVGPPASEKLGAEDVRKEFEQAGYQLQASLDLLPYQYVLVFQAAPVG